MTWFDQGLFQNQKGIPIHIEIRTEDPLLKNQSGLSQKIFVVDWFFVLVDNLAILNPSVYHFSQ